MKAILFFLVLAAVLVRAEGEVQTKPFLVVVKHVSESHVIVGSSLDVTTTVTNYGQSPAFDIQLTDSSPFEGEQKKTQEKLEFNESVEIKYTIIPKNLGPLSLPVASASYLTEQGAATRLLATSNFVLEDLRDPETGRTEKGIVHVVTATEYERKHTRHVKEWVMYLFLATVPVLFPYYIFKSKSNQADQLLRQANKK